MVGNRRGSFSTGRLMSYSPSGVVSARPSRPHDPRRLTALRIGEESDEEQGSRQHPARTGRGHCLRRGHGRPEPLQRPHPRASKESTENHLPCWREIRTRTTELAASARRRFVPSITPASFEANACRCSERLLRSGKTSDSLERSALESVNSHSQTVATFHPAFRRAAMFSLSRPTFRFSFVSQLSLFVFGTVAFEQPGC